VSNCQCLSLNVLGCDGWLAAPQADAADCGEGEEDAIIVRQKVLVKNIAS